MMASNNVLTVEEVIPYAPVPGLFADIQLVVSLPQYVDDPQVELLTRGEQLDNLVAALWKKERCLVEQRSHAADYDQYQAITAELDLIWYQMTRLQDELDRDGRHESEDGVLE